MKIEKKLAFAFGLLLVIALALFSCSTNKTKEAPIDDVSDHYREMVNSKFHDKAKRYGADSQYLIIVDYSIPSNRPRLFVWDTERDQIVDQFWCAHGFGGHSTAEKPEFSNVLGSNCSSLGWFLVERGVGVSPRWGYQYHAVDGLDASNSNARRRQLLIHPWSSVSDDEANQISTPMTQDYRSAGCFTMSENGYQTIHELINSRTKRLLLIAIDGVD